MDITRTFSATNIPLEKLGHPEMKDFFAKYLVQYPLVHPTNCRGTWLPKVGTDQRAKIERIFRKQEHFVVFFADESDDSRPTEDTIHCIASSIATAGNNFCKSCLVGSESC